MTVAVEDDYADFVAARWPDLSAVATLACLEPQAAVSITADAFTSVRRHWSTVVESGAPTRAARAELLRRAAALPPSDPGTWGAVPLEPAEVGPARSDGAHEVVEVLLDALHGEPPLTRAAIGAGALWGIDDEETFALAGVRPDRHRADLAGGGARLRAAHRAARAAVGLGPGDEYLEEDLLRVVQRLTTGQLDRPEPGVLDAGPRWPSRRSLIVVGGTLAMGAAGWWLAGNPGLGLRDGPASGPRPGDAGVAPDDPVWASTEDWPIRGAVGAALGTGRVAESGGRLVWADEVGNQRLVVSVVPPTVTGSTVRLASGPARAVGGTPTMVPLARDRVEGAADVVAVVGPTADGSGGSVLVVLGRPTVPSAEVSTVVRPTRAGTVEREWRTVPLEGGAGAVRLDAPVGPAFRVRCGRYDGPPASVASARPDGQVSERAEVERRVAEFVSSATAIPVGRLETRTVVDSPAGGNVVDGSASAPGSGRGRVLVTTTTTPDGAVVPAVHVRDDAGRAAWGRFWGPLTVGAPDDLLAPVVRRVTDLAPKVARFLVVAPGAARARILVSAGGGSSTSDITPLSGDAAIVAVVYDRIGAGRYHLDLWDESGRRTYSAVPPFGVPLLDLG